MGNATKPCQACKYILDGLIFLLERIRTTKISSLLASIITSGLVFKLYTADELLGIAASMHNRCLGTTLTSVTQLLLLGESTTGRILFAYVVVANIAGSYFRRLRWVEAHELAIALITSIALLITIVALNLGATHVVSQCLYVV